jgi:hypothetical protein
MLMIEFTILIQIYFKSSQLSTTLDINTYFDRPTEADTLHMYLRRAVVRA